MRIEGVGSIRRQVERDAARPGLDAHVGSGDLLHLDAAAAGLGAHLAADRIGLDVSTARLRVQASARALDANAARSRLRPNGAVNASDRLVTRPRLRVDTRVGGYHELIADGDVAVCRIVIGFADADDVAGLYDWRRRFDLSDALGRIEPIAP